MGGGFPHHSTALLIGPPGIGKTTLGLHFLSECNRDAPGLHFGFYETPVATLDKAKALQLPVERLIQQGHIEVIWQPTTEGLLDETCDRLVEAVRRRGVRRLFIDGLQEFDRLAPERDRLGHIFSAFSSEFRGLGVSTLYTAESDLIGPVLGLPLSGLSLQGISCIAEIILVTRYVELRSQLHRMISVLKVRDSEINSAFHEFTITKNGILTAPDSATAENILAEAAAQGRRANSMGSPKSTRDCVSVALILIVDDEYSVAEVLEAILTEVGHEVVTAANGRQGLERANERTPDVVLLDFMMPILGGASMLKTLQKTPALREVPVVIMSSLPERTISESSGGMYAAFLRKPFRRKAVIDIVSAVLGRHG